jgi:hypothetical protein
MAAYLDLDGKLHFEIFDYDDTSKMDYKLIFNDDLKKLIESNSGIRSLFIKRQGMTSEIDILLDMSDFSFLNLEVSAEFMLPQVELELSHKQNYVKPTIFNHFNCDTTQLYIICGI